MVAIVHIVLHHTPNKSVDITIELRDERPGAEMQLKITADVKEKKYEIRKSKERTIRRISDEKMYVYDFIRHFEANMYESPCDKAKEVGVELFEYRRKYGFSKKISVFSERVSLRDDELYTEKKFRSVYSYYRMVPLLTDI